MRSCRTAVPSKRCCANSRTDTSSPASRRRAVPSRLAKNTSAQSLVRAKRAKLFAASNYPTSTICSRRGPCAPSTIVCSMSPVRDGPETMLTARGVAPRSRANQRERFFHRPRRCVRRARSRCACRAAARSPSAIRRRSTNTSVPVSAIAQKRAGDADASRRPGRPRLDRKTRAAPVECRRTPASTRRSCDFAASASADSQVERVDVTRHGSRNVVDAAMRSTVLAMSVARARNRCTRSPGIAGRGPCACAAMYACARARAASSGPSRAERRARARAPHRGTPRCRRSRMSPQPRPPVRHEFVEPRDALLDRRIRRRVREADVLAVARHAAAEMDVGEHGDARFVQQPLAERLGVGAARRACTPRVTLGHA